MVLYQYLVAPTTTRACCTITRGEPPTPWCTSRANWSPPLQQYFFERHAAYTCTYSNLLSCLGVVTRRTHNKQQQQHIIPLVYSTSHGSRSKQWEYERWLWEPQDEHLIAINSEGYWERRCIALAPLVRWYKTLLLFLWSDGCSSCTFLFEVYFYRAGVVSSLSFRYNYTYALPCSSQRCGWAASDGRRWNIYRLLLSRQL